MMEPVHRVNGTQTQALEGAIKPDYPKIFYIGGLLLAAFLCIPFYTSLSAVILFVVLTFTTMLFGHSIGMHRMMIHRSFTTSKPIARLLIYIGVIVGMASTYRILYIHDIRDWAQRFPQCHDFFSHRKSYLQDLSWQLFARFEFKSLPEFYIEAELKNDAWIRHMDKYFYLHQCAFAYVLYAAGGMDWLTWGLLVRIPFCIIMHWTVTYFCHNEGQRDWVVRNADVQASNLQHLGWLTFGECWHNNHHAFPESARIGLYAGQHDMAWNIISYMHKLGMVHTVRLPRAEHLQDDLLKAT